jgi:uroporphyrinogen-III synthase
MSTLKDDKLPLSGTSILVTRSAHQARDFTDKLKILGAQPIELSVIEIQPPDSWGPIDDAIDAITKYDWLLFASSNAVAAFISRLRIKQPSFAAQWNANKMPRVAVIGTSTEKLAIESGLPVDYKPSVFIAETFIEEFPGYPSLSGLNFLWPRADIGRNYIEEKLGQASGKVEIVNVYKTGLPSDIVALSNRFHQLLRDEQFAVLTLASAQTAANLATVIAHKWRQENKVENGKGQDEAYFVNRIKDLLKNITVLSIGPETSSGARKHLGKVDLEANPHSVDGMIIALLKHFAGGKAQN